eukprot:c23355_g1_i1.p1 GENE.c23355_g1_i1~~c23355_g1_i1.p1  ORF type:complete len:109 (+),score=20.84 c23355_g1_i1:49-327(+)
MSSKKHPAGVLTQKYDMGKLKKLNEIEVWSAVRLSEIYGAPEDALPVEIDIHELVDLETKDQRTTRLEKLLNKAPHDTHSFIEELVERVGNI